MPRGDDRDSTPKISDAEWRVMQVLWERQPLSSSAVIAALEPRQDWHPKTIQTLLGRLVKKGFVRTEPQSGGRYLYRAAVERTEVVRKEGRSFLDRVFAGDAASLLLHFAREAELSPDEAEELRQILAAPGSEEVP